MEYRRIIRDPEVIAILLDFGRATYLLPFRRGPHTVAQAARDRDLKPNQMAYWVERFLDAGLIEPVAAAEGARRAGQAYQTTAEEFILLPGEGYAAEEVVERQYGPMWRGLQADISHDTDRMATRWVIRVFLLNGRMISCQEVPLDQIDAGDLVAEGNALNLWMTVRFDPATLAELRAELDALFVRYAGRTVKGESDLPRHVLHIALAKKAPK